MNYYMIVEQQRIQFHNVLLTQLQKTHRQQPEGSYITWCQNKCLHSGHNHQTNGDVTCTCRYMQVTICGSEPLHKAVLIRMQTLVLQHTCPQAAAFLIPFSQYRSRIACFFVGENILRLDLSMYHWQPIWTIITHSKHATLNIWLDTDFASV